MNVKTFNRLAHTITLIVFLMASALYAAEDSRSFFKDKKVDHKKLSTESEDRILQKKTMLKAKGGKVPVRKRLDKRILSAHLEDLSGIHIPQNMGRVVEVYQSPSSESRLIVHIQDLHTNPEAQLNEAGILDALIKDYGLSLVCSEGAEGKVDTSSVSSFPDPEVRKKTALLFINSGELTAEEYLSITKYPDLPIWGIEDKDVYFKNIIQFNKIMRFNPKSLELISKIQNSLEGVKDKIFSKELLALEAKEKDYEEENIETEEYLEHITGYMEGLNIATSNYKNIALLNETMGREEDIDQEKIMQESQALVMRLEEELSNKYLKKEKNSLLAQAQLFKNEKISAFSFYSYLKEYSDKYLPDGLSAYPHLEGFVDYLVKINELDATKLFNEIDELTHEVKNRLASTKEEKDLIHASRNIKFLEDFFNLEIS
ncbi:MAG: hypothetical protein QGI05_00355, partial [Candidatus Omnitrophota bacterium]|nr:hypothetical protein [Candidatus Omnitrophota bacterium]